jgi:hypothetical protein
MTQPVRTVRKDRVDRSGFEDKIRRGPTHQITVDGHQTWCGRKIIGLVHWNNQSDPADVDCGECKRAVAKGQPRAWRR